MAGVLKAVEKIVSQGILLKGRKAPKFDLGNYFRIAFKLILAGLGAGVVAGILSAITGFSIDTVITAMGTNLPAGAVETAPVAVLGAAFSLVLLKWLVLSLIISFATVWAGGWLMKKLFRGIPARAHPIMVALNVGMLGVITALFGGIGIILVPYLVDWLLGWE